MQIQKHIGKTLVKVPEFAARKNVTTPGVWKAVNSDRLPVILVGKNKDVYIDWEENKEFHFNENKKNK